MSGDGPITREHFYARIEHLLATCGAHGHDRVCDIGVTESSARRCEALMEALSQQGVPWPYAFPALEGGVSLEWDIGPWSVSLEISDAVIYGDATNLHTHDGIDFELEATASDADVLAEVALMFARVHA